MGSIWIAEAKTRRCSWRAVGHDADQACQALENAMTGNYDTRHRVREFMADDRGNVNITELVIGQGYQDYSPEGERVGPKGYEPTDDANQILADYND